MLGIPPDAFLEQAAAAIRDARGWTSGWSSVTAGDIANILQFGTERPA
jgi:hypothetical protein